MVAQVRADMVVERFEAGCLARGFTPGSLRGADPSAPLSEAILQRVGRRSLRYGELWDRILWLEALFPGEVVVQAGGAPRAATGPDVLRSILEARGRLGTCSQLWLRVFPVAKERLQIEADADSLPHAVSALAQVLRAGARPAEVDLAGKGTGAKITLQFEGDPALAAAEAGVAHRALTAAGLGPERSPAAPASGGAGAGPTFEIEGTWTELPRKLEEIVPRLGEHLLGQARLAWLTHEAAAITLPLPPGGSPVETASHPSAALMGKLAEALERRCR